jgi:putative membrane protein
MLTPGVITWTEGWWYVKLTAVVLMTGLHGAMSKWRREFMEDRNTRSPRFYRIVNELPTVLLVIIVIMVIVRPF